MIRKGGTGLLVQQKQTKKTIIDHYLDKYTIINWTGKQTERLKVKKLCTPSQQHLQSPSTL